MFAGMEQFAVLITFYYIQHSKDAMIPVHVPAIFQVH